MTLIAAPSRSGAQHCDHAKQGEIVLESINHGSKAHSNNRSDQGPAFLTSPSHAIRYSTRKGLAWVCLVQMLVDEFDIVSKVGKGTTVTIGNAPVVCKPHEPKCAFIESGVAMRALRSDVSGDLHWSNRFRTASCSR